MDRVPTDKSKSEAQPLLPDPIRDGNSAPSIFDNEWLNTEQAASYLALSVGALRNLTSNGQVPYYKLGNRNRFLKSELKDLLLRNKRGGSHGL